MTTENVFENARVYRNAQVTGNAQVYGNAQVTGDAEIWIPGHLVTTTWGDQSVTLHRTVGGGHLLVAGCQEMTLEDDHEAVAQENGWFLPPGWGALKNFLYEMADSWKTEGGE